MKHQHLLALGLLALSSTFLAGCGGGGSPSFGSSTSTNTNTNTNTNTGDYAATSYTYSKPFVTDNGEPQSLAINPTTGNLYAADFTGGFSVYAPGGTVIGNYGTSGSGKVISGFGIALDSSGNVYVGDYQGGEVQEFTSSGSYIKTFTGSSSIATGVAVNSAGDVFVSNDLGTVNEFNSSGTAIGQFSTPGQAVGLAIDPSGDLWVPIYGGLLKHYTSSGQLLGTYGTSSSTPGLGHVDSAYNVYVDPTGNVYMTDASLPTVQKLNSAGQFVTYFGQNQVSGGAGGVAVDTSGNVYVSCNSVTASNQILEYSAGSGANAEPR